MYKAVIYEVDNLSGHISKRIAIYEDRRANSRLYVRSAIKYSGPKGKLNFARQ